jgi:hypothetical protein
MELLNSSFIKQIKGCPNNNESGTLRVYRIVSNPINRSSFTFYGTQEKYKLRCEAWGLSVFTNIDTAKKMLKGLSKNMALNYSSIAFADIEDEDGVKYKTRSKDHYTFFPQKNLDLTTKFINIQNENEQ